MLSTFAVCFWATTAFAACNVKTKVHYVRAADDRSRDYFPERLQSRASSMFGPTGQPQTAASTGFPYRFVFPANHPALSGSTWTLQNSHQSEPLFSAEDLFSPQPANNHQHPLSDHKHHHHHNHQQQQQQQQHQHLNHLHQQQQPIGFETIGKMQYELFGGGGGVAKHHAQPPQHQYHFVKQPKHYQSFELGPNALIPTIHQTPSYPSTSASIAQPIMLLIPSSGQPGAPYQTLVLVPSSVAPPPPQPAPIFTGFHHQFQPHVQAPAQLLPGFVTHPRGPPLVTGFPSGLGGGGGGLGKYPGPQLFHRSHEPHQQHQSHTQHSTQQQQEQQQQHQHQQLQQQQQLRHHHQQQQQKQQQQQQLRHHQHAQHKGPPPPSSLSPSYQVSGSVNVPHTTATGAAVQQPIEDKVSHGSGASGENADDRVENSAETKRDEKSPEFGDKTSTRPPKRIVVT